MVGIIDRNLDHAHRIADQHEGLRVLHRHDHERAVVIVDANLEDCGDFVADLPRHGTEWGRTSLRIDYSDRVTNAGANIFGEAHPDGDLACTGLQLGEVAADRLRSEIVEVFLNITTYENGFDTAVEAAQQRLFNQGARVDHPRRCTHFLEDVFPIVHPAAISLDDSVPVQSGDLV